MNFFKRLFKRLIGIDEPIYNESSDCFDAAKFWLEQYNKEKEELKQIMGKDKTYIEELIQSRQKEEQIKKQIIKRNNAHRYSLNYLYKHKR